MRVGKISKDFEKWNDESKCVDFLKCFVVFYGSEFKLKSLSVVGKSGGRFHHPNYFAGLIVFVFVVASSIAALSELECENWIRGLRYMVADTISSLYPLDMERWLRKEFYYITSQNSRDFYK